MEGLADIGRRAGLLEREGRFNEAEALLRDAIAAAGQNPAITYALGILLLRQGRFEEGWPLYEARHFLAGNRRKPQLSFPEWDGNAVRSLLLLPEQGFGDQIMFARYAPILKTRGIDVTLACEASLARLFSPLGVRILPISGSAELPRHDAWALVGSLPRYLGNVPSTPYLAGKVQVKGGVGLIATGNALPDPHRSLDKLSTAHLTSNFSARSLMPQDTGAKDFQDTADLMAGLDMVITVDTSGAHLAGAMGIPTVLLLPHLADWRWGLEGRTPWYPSVKLVRQKSPGDWMSALAQIKTFEQ